MGNYGFTIAFCGYGRAGKDESGKYLGEITPLCYVGSLSNIVTPLIARDLGISPERAWTERHKNRAFWKAWCDAYRKEDPAKLIKESLAQGDIVVGIRDKVEIEAAKKERLIDLLVWIDRTDNAIDPTVTYTASDCDVVLLNDGSVEDLHDRVYRLAKAFNLYEGGHQRDSRAGTTTQVALLAG